MSNKATNGRQFAELETEFRKVGFTNYRAIARVIHDKTGHPYYQVYRALLYITDSPKYCGLMQQTLEQLKQE